MRNPKLMLAAACLLAGAIASPVALAEAPGPAVKALFTKALLSGAVTRTYDDQRTAERAAQGRRLRDLAGVTD